MPNVVSHGGIDAFKQLASLLAACLKFGETSIGNISIYLRLKGIPSSPSNSRKLYISTTPDRMQQLVSIIDKGLGAESVARHGVARLVGALGFPKHRFIIDAPGRRSNLYIAHYIRSRIARPPKRLLGVFRRGWGELYMRYSSDDLRQWFRNRLSSIYGLLVRRGYRAAFGIWFTTVSGIFRYRAVLIQFPQEYRRRA